MAEVNSIRNRLSLALRGARTQFRDLGRFQRLRVLIVAALAFDVVGTAAYVLASHYGADDLAVSYREEFPTRLLVVRNGARVLTDAEVVLDERFRFVIPRLEVGPIGIDLRDFRDSNGLSPDPSYRPAAALIVTPEDRFELSVGLDDTGS